jgi:hypothetical protein
MKESSAPQEQRSEMNEAELMSFFKIQNVLALAEFFKENEIAEDPFATLASDTPRSRDLRHKASQAWTALRADGKPTLAESFSAYWQSDRKGIKAADLTSQAVRLDLVEKLRGLREELKKPTRSIPGI